MTQDFKYYRLPHIRHSGKVLFRNYTLTCHSISRYVERIGGDVRNMICDVQRSWVLHEKDKNIDKKTRDSVIRCKAQGFWALTNGEAVFIVSPERGRSVVVTTIIYGENKNTAYRKSNKRAAKCQHH